MFLFSCCSTATVMGPTLFLLLCFTLNLHQVTPSGFNIEPLLAGKCTQQFPIDRGTIEEILGNSKMPNDHNAKCWLDCGLRTLGIIRNGKVNWGPCKAFMRTKWKSPEERKIIDQVIEACKAEIPESVSDDKDCELAYKIGLCKIKYGEKLGLKKITFSK